MCWKKLVDSCFNYWAFATVVLALVTAWLIISRVVWSNIEPAVHYHADFQIYINGQQQALDHFSFYEEVTACSAVYQNRPTSRAHLHNEVASVIHVHDHAVTYSHFLSNLGFSLSDDVLQTRTDIYRDGEAGQLRFILNGQLESSLANQVIQNEDVLLIDFGNDDLATLHQRHQAIPRGAPAANEAQDPASCRGDGETASFWERLQKAVGL